MSNMASTSSAEAAGAARPEAHEAKPQTADFASGAAAPGCRNTSRNDNLHSNNSVGHSSNSSGALVTGSGGVGSDDGKETRSKVAAASPAAAAAAAAAAAGPATSPTAGPATGGGGGGRGRNSNTGGDMITAATTTTSSSTTTTTTTAMSHIPGTRATEGGVSSSAQAPAVETGTARAAGAAKTGDGHSGRAESLAVAADGENAHAHALTDTSTTTHPPTSAPVVPIPTTTGGAATSVENDAAAYEEEHVHSVYESIAPHFSATRYKPWPVIAAFLESQPRGALGLDVGCGNGKYLGVNPSVHIVGSDRSARLVRIARDHGGPPPACRDVAVADGLALPFVRGRADFAICVAVIHHLSTRPRRQDAVRALLECVTPRDGKVLVYVWALEQASSRRGWDEGADQDQLVPWVFREKKQKQPKVKEGTEGAATTTAAATGEGGGDTTYQRYYHLYRKGELEEDVIAAGGSVVDSGYDRDNWWVIASRAN